MAKPKTTKTTKPKKTKETKDEGIPISPKHGLNPSLGVCFYCGKETGEVVLHGYIKGDEEAPKHTVVSYEPCKECQAQWKDNVTFIGVTAEKPVDNRPMIDKKNKLYPTGVYVVVTEDCGRRILNIPENEVVPPVVLMDNEIVLDFIQKGEEANGSTATETTDNQ